MSANRTTKLAIAFLHVYLQMVVRDGIPSHVLWLFKFDFCIGEIFSG